MTLHAPVLRHRLAQRAPLVWRRGWCAAALAGFILPALSVAQAPSQAQAGGLPSSVPVLAVPAAPAAALASAPGAPGKAVVQGVVPDEATRQMLLLALRQVYGDDRVVDQLGVGPLVAPPNWSGQVQKIITNSLKQVRKGELRVRGNIVEIRGEVDNEALRQQVVSDLVNLLGNPTYTVRNRLLVAAAPQQDSLDAALANRTVEFLPASALLTPNGKQVLDDLVPLLAKFQGKRFEVIGHTDNLGLREGNVTLSANRANTVRQYLAGRGIPYASILTSGAGPDRPIAPNDTAEGQARNRRIEFKVLP